MKLLKNKLNPLEDYTPSLFVLASPFQAMCAIEAIEEFKISNYKILIVKSNSPRDKQLYRYLDEQGVEYTICELSSPHYAFECLSPLFGHREKEYHRAFLGDSENKLLYHFAFKYLYPNSVISFIDDGTKEIPILAGRRNRKFDIFFWAKWFNRKLLNIEISDSYFTLFSDIASPKFQCRNNRFTHVSKRTSGKMPMGVYYIGTNSKMYCKKLNIRYEDYKDSLGRSLDSICMKYEGQPIYYIPHGRDMNVEIRELCESHGVIYQCADKTVELYMLAQPTKPYAIYANTSTALFNLKLFYPDVPIYNIFTLGNPKSRYYADYVMYSEYFEKHGVEWIKMI